MSYIYAIQAEPAPLFNSCIKSEVFMYILDFKKGTLTMYSFCQKCTKKSAVYIVKYTLFKMCHMCAMNFLNCISQVVVKDGLHCTIDPLLYDHSFERSSLYDQTCWQHFTLLCCVSCQKFFWAVPSLYGHLGGGGAERGSNKCPRNKIQLYFLVRSIFSNTVIILNVEFYLYKSYRVLDININFAVD